MTAGRGSISTPAASAASFACASVSATTKAMGSPTKRTLSVASAGRLVCNSGEPPRPLRGGRPGRRRARRGGGVGHEQGGGRRGFRGRAGGEGVVAGRFKVPAGPDA